MPSATEEMPVTKNSGPIRISISDTAWVGLLKQAYITGKTGHNIGKYIDNVIAENKYRWRVNRPEHILSSDADRAVYFNRHGTMRYRAASDVLLSWNNSGYRIQRKIQLGEETINIIWDLRGKLHLGSGTGAQPQVTGSITRVVSNFLEGYGLKWIEPISDSNEDEKDYNVALEEVLAAWQKDNNMRKIQVASYPRGQKTIYVSEVAWDALRDLAERHCTALGLRASISMLIEAIGQEKIEIIARGG